MPAVRLESVDTGDGMPTIYVPLEQLVDTCRALRDTPELRFAFLVDFLPVDYLPREPRFEIVYLMASLGVGGLWRYAEAAARQGARARRRVTRAVGFGRVAGGRLVRTRGVRSVRHPFQRSP